MWGDDHFPLVLLLFLACNQVVRLALCPEKVRCRVSLVLDVLDVHSDPALIDDDVERGCEERGGVGRRMGRKVERKK